MTTATLGVRALGIARAEHRAGAASAPYGEPNTSSAVRRYLVPCVRDVDGDGDLERLGLTVGNWCSAFVSWCLEQTVQPGEERPHLYRAGVVELVADAQALGRWFPLDTVSEGFQPQPGDLAIWDRSKPNDPSTSWWRHVNRVISYNTSDSATILDDEFETIGGNERRAIRIARHRPKELPPGKLLGFISYAQAKVEKNTPTRDEHLEDLRGQIAMFHEQMKRAALEQVRKDALTT